METTPNIFSNRDQVNNFMRSKFHVKVPLSTASIGFALTDMEPQTSANGRVAVYHTDTTTKANLLSLFETHLEVVEKDLNRLATIPKVSVIYTPALPLRTLTKWGLVLVDASMVPRQTNVLYTLENRRIVKEVSFSIYQMFFGDVITPAWWDNRWVARGLSNYLVPKQWLKGRRTFSSTLSTRLFGRLTGCTLGSPTTFSTPDTSTTPTYFWCRTKVNRRSSVHTHSVA